jgi:GTP pyrophosphokinase
VHKADCHNLSGFADSPERFLDIDWDYEGGAGAGHVGGSTS